MKSISTVTVRASRSLDQIAAWGRHLIIFINGGLMIFGALAYGAVHPWAYFSVALAITTLSLALLAAGLIRLYASSGEPFRLPYPPMWWIAVGIVVLTLIQMAPWPQGLVARVVPAAWKIRNLGEGFGLAASMPLSLNPYSTLLQFFKIWPCIVLFFLFIYSIDRRWQLQRLVEMILATALFEVIYGAWHFHSHLIWGWPNPYAGQRLTGTFINSNHLAIFLTMSLFLGFGLFLSQAVPLGKTATAPMVGSRWLRLARPDYLEPRQRQFLLLLLLFLLGVGLIFTYSRGALISLGLGLYVMTWLSWKKSWGRGHVLGLVALLAAAVLYSLFVEGPQIFQRFYSLTDKGRVQAYWGALSIWREFPWLGSGLGTFGDLSYGFETGEFQAAHFIYTHSDWLQLLAETGLGGFLLMAAAGLVFLKKLVWKWRRRQDPFARGLGLGGLAALAAGCTEALVEFPFHIPAITYLFAGCAAITYLAVYSRLQEPYFSYPVTEITSSSQVATILFLFLFGFQLVFITQVSYHWKAESLAPVEIDSTRLRPNPTEADFRAALNFNPRNSRNYLKLAGALEHKNRGDEASVRETLRLLQAAVFYAPGQWEGHLYLGEFSLRHFKRAPSYYIPMALKELAAAQALYPEYSTLKDRLATVLYWTENYHPDLVPSELAAKSEEPGR
jgi:hypothetical protein